MLRNQFMYSADGGESGGSSAPAVAAAPTPTPQTSTDTAVAESKPATAAEERKSILLPAEGEEGAGEKVIKKLARQARKERAKERLEAEAKFAQEESESIDDGLESNVAEPIADDADPDSDPGDETDADGDDAFDDGAEELDQALVAAARKFGMPDDVIDSFDTSAQLERFLRKAIESNKRRQPPKEQTKPRDYAKLKEQFDPELIDLIESGDQRYALLEEKYSALEERYASLERDAKSRAEQQQIAELDRAMNSLDDDMKSVFGIGHEHATKKQMANLKRLGDEVDRLESGYRARGERIPPVEALIKKAIRAEFYDQLTKTEARKTDDKVADRRSMFIPRASTNGNGANSADAILRKTREILSRA